MNIFKKLVKGLGDKVSRMFAEKSAKDSVMNIPTPISAQKMEKKIYRRHRGMNKIGKWMKRRFDHSFYFKQRGRSPYPNPMSGVKYEL